MVWRRVSAALVGAVAVLVVPVTPAFARAGCSEQLPVGKDVQTTPAEMTLYSPASLAPFATGRGVRVAVIDSGVDATNPQLKGKVLAGKDFLRNDPDARQDCVGHGTEVASIIAGSPVEGGKFQGLAPDATIIPIRVTEATAQDKPGQDQGKTVSQAKFADSIDWAVTVGHADVINLSLVTTEPDALVQAAIQRALAADVVVVAAAGNNGTATDGNEKPFPAADDGVIGVGALKADGTRADFSQHGDWVDVMAAGVEVTMALPGKAGTLNQDSGTSFAAPFVSATAALIKQRFPGITSAQVAQRIEATADPSPESGGAGGRSENYGFGELNPYRALTEVIASGPPPSAAPQVMSPKDPAAVALEKRRADSQRLALIIAGAGAALVGLIAAAAIVVRRGRRRGWEPGVPGQRENDGTRTPVGTRH